MANEVLNSRNCVTLYFHIPQVIGGGFTTKFPMEQTPQ